MPILKEALLTKLSQGGKESLTPEEMAMLKGELSSSSSMPDDLTGIPMSEPNKTPEEEDSGFPLLAGTLGGFGKGFKGPVMPGPAAGAPPEALNKEMLARNRQIDSEIRSRGLRGPMAARKAEALAEGNRQMMEARARAEPSPKSGSSGLFNRIRGMFSRGGGGGAPLGAGKIGKREP